MNPHFLPPQQYGGGPQPVFSPINPQMQQQSFQNIPLGPTKAGQLPEASTLGPRQQIPPNQLPPTVQQKDSFGHNVVDNVQQQQQLFQNGQSSLSVSGRPPGGFPPTPAGPTPVQNLPPRPASNQSNLAQVPPVNTQNQAVVGGQGQFGGQQQMAPASFPPPPAPSSAQPQLGPPFAPVGKQGQVPRPGQPNLGGFSGVSGPYPPMVGPPGPQQQFGGTTGQISSQLQQMNLSGPKPPFAATRPPTNGDTGPHMPPPLNQQTYQQQQQNGQQPPPNRRPPAAGGGYPPMPGQMPPPMPGQMPPPMPGQMPPPMPGQLPPMPGQMPQGQYPHHPPPGHPHSYPEQPKQKQLDPDDVPSPIQVFQEDQANRGGVFVTNDKGLMPPLVTTNFVVQDQGNCSPRFIRSTMYNVPCTQDICKQTAIPFSLIISPMARQVDQEYPPPIVDFGALGPVRCIRCKAYMCPFMQFVDSGRRFQCLFCMATTDVPTEYFQHLDQSGLRMDRFERPELILGTYEFVATSDYCRNQTLPHPPAFVFLIDVSYNNIKSGLVPLLCSQMKQILRHLPVDQHRDKSDARVGFITYDSTVHFYNVKGSLAAPQMLVVGDVKDVFMPLLDGFLVTPEESEAVIDLLMEQIPRMFQDTRNTETILLPAIQAGLEALKASGSVGKLLVFHSTLPQADAPGRLKNRDDRKVLGTDKEKVVLQAQCQEYNKLGQECVANGCSVDLFVANNAYVDLATVGQVARLTGGEVFKYTYFQADLDGERLINDVIMDISRPIAFDGVMRVRTSAGIRPTDFYGHFYMSNTTDIELASIDCDKAIGVEIKHDDKLTPGAGTYVQAALLYTSCSGQRRLRIMNLSLKTCSEMADIYRSCDLDTLLNYMAKQAVYKLLDNNPKAVKDSLINRSAQILATYRKHCASPSSVGQLILPECMKLLPVYVNCLLKNDAISGGADMTVDDKTYAMQAVMTMDVANSVYHFYPRLIPLHNIDPATVNLPDGGVALPSPIRCSANKMSEQGVYILENGIHMFLWFGLGVNPEFIQQLFGAASAIQVDIDKTALPELDNPISIAVRAIVDEIRIQRHRCMRLTLVRQREKLEPVFKHFLVEDRGADGSASYVDFLCHMHKEIRQILS